MLSINKACKQCASHTHTQKLNEQQCKLKKRHTSYKNNDRKLSISHYHFPKFNEKITKEKIINWNKKYIN
jgi:hypothetical protein